MQQKLHSLLIQQQQHTQSINAKLASIESELQFLKKQLALMKVSISTNGDLLKGFKEQILSLKGFPDVDELMLRAVKQLTGVIDKCNEATLQRYDELGELIVAGIKGRKRFVDDTWSCLVSSEEESQKFDREYSERLRAVFRTHGKLKKQKHHGQAATSSSRD